jgi:tetratricopeptide (TPR) repeat protein
LSVRATILALSVAVALAALAVQLVSDGLYGGLATAPSLPHALAGDWPFALLARIGLDRIPSVRVALARGAIARNQPARALELLAPLRPTSEVTDLRGRVALAQGDSRAALRDFAAAGDYTAAQTALAALGARDPAAGLVVVRDFERRLDASRSDPQVAAEVDWLEGKLAAAAARTRPAAAAAYEREALDADRRALARAPNDEKYLLNEAFAGLLLGDAADALVSYRHAAEVVPDSVDAFAGVAVTEAVLGDCAAARTALERAQALAQQQHRRSATEGAGYAPSARAALARCSA